MTLEQRVTKLEQLYANLSDSFIQAQKNQVVDTAKTDDNSNNIKTLTPYTETKVGYYGETEKVFYDVPSGNTTVFFDNYTGSYSVSRLSNQLAIHFDALTEQTNITISVS